MAEPPVQSLRHRYLYEVQPPAPEIMQSGNVGVKKGIGCAPDRSVMFPDMTTVESVGELIGLAITSTEVGSCIESVWDQSFSEISCPLCDCSTADGHDSEPSSSNIYPMLRSDPPVPLCIKFIPKTMAPFMLTAPGSWDRNLSYGSNSLTHSAWVKRALTRSRGDQDDESSAYGVDFPSGHRVEVFYPFEFHSLRHALGVDDRSFAESISNSRAVRPKGGKSTARFGVTKDGLYIFKSVNRKEELLFRKMGPAFFWYYCRVWFQNVPSLLLPLFGMFSVVAPDRKRQRRTYIIVRNISSADSQMLCDLKGVGIQRTLRPFPSGDGSVSDSSSEHGLFASPADGYVDSTTMQDRLIQQDGQLSPTSGQTVLWDQDFRTWRDDIPLRLSPDNYSFTHAAVFNDTEFLSSLQIVDYSLFLSFHQADPDGKSIIVGGIIDFLRPYTWDKKIESVVKTVNNNIAQLGSILSKSEDGPAVLLDMARAPTVISPDLYSKRFRANVMSCFSPTSLSESISKPPT